VASLGLSGITIDDSRRQLEIALAEGFGPDATKCFGLEYMRAPNGWNTYQAHRMKEMKENSRESPFGSTILFPKSY